MSPNQQQQAQQGHATQEQNRQSLLDQVLEQTPKVQSIRNTAAQFLGVPPERVCDLLRNVWRTSKGQPELTDAEMFAGMSMIARFGLDPIAREVYVTRTSKGLVTIIGIDGWIKVLNRTEGYDGFEQSEEWDEAGNLKCVETRIYTKERSRPTTYRGYAKEYTRMAGVVAQNMPWHMLRLFSLRHAARLFTPIGGSVVTEEEARWMDAYAATPEEDRTRKNVLRDRVKTAASEFEPIPQGEQEQSPTAEEAALPPNPPTAEEQRKVEAGEPVNQTREPRDGFDPLAWCESMFSEIGRTRARIADRRKIVGDICEAHRAGKIDGEAKETLLSECKRLEWPVSELLKALPTMFDAGK